MVDVQVGRRAVKAVLIGLAFASLVTWTIFIAKMIELIQRKLRAALAKIADARSLAEAQFALGSKGSVLACCSRRRCARPAVGGITSDAGIKERAASRTEIVRAGRADGSGWVCWRPSARRPRSSDFSARSGAS
jgi:biopolymer transport protein ExbB/TolQ